MNVQAVGSEDVNCLKWMFVSHVQLGWIHKTSCMDVVRERNKH